MMLPFPNCFSMPLNACDSAFSFSLILLMDSSSPRDGGAFMRRARGASSRERAIQRPVLHRLCDVRGAHGVRALEVGDRPRDPQHLVVRARREAQPLDRRLEQPPARVVWRAVPTERGAAQ